MVLAKVKKFTPVMLDIGTIDRLRRAASGRPLAQYIREISKGLPDSVSDRLAVIDNKLDNVLINAGFFFKDNEGRMTPVRNMPSKMVFKEDGSVDLAKSQRPESVFEALQRMSKENGHK